MTAMETGGNFLNLGLPSLLAASMRILLTCLAFMTGLFCAAQTTGPGGIGTSSTNVLWLRADAGVFSDAGVTPAVTTNDVRQWNDQSGNGKNAAQATVNQQPNYFTNVMNGFPVLRFDGSGTSPDFVTSAGVTTGNGAAVWVVASYTSLAAATFNSGLIHATVSGGGQGGAKNIGMWVSGTNSVAWGRGIQTDGTSVNLSSTTGFVTSANTVYVYNNIYDNTVGPPRVISQFVNGNTSSSVNYDGTLASWTDVQIGDQGGNSNAWFGDIAEVIAYNTPLNTAQRLIIDNYLSAKYNTTLLAAKDLYTGDNSGYDYEVAGIGMATATESQTDSKGSGFVRILNATDLQAGEYFIWGHDNGTAQATNTTDVPAGVNSRFARTWMVTETGEVGNIDIQFDVTGLPDFTSLSNCDAATAIRLLVDTNNDGNFADQTPISGATNIGGNVYRFANVTPVNTGNRFTIGIVSTAVTGPGGIGATNGTSSLALWLTADALVQADNSNVTSWTDGSGYSNTANAPAGNEPVYRSSLATFNNRPFVRFTGANTDYLRVANAASLNPNTVSILLVGQYNNSSASNAPWLIKTTNNTLPDGYGLMRNAATTTQQTFVTTTANLASGALAINTPNIFTSVYDKTDIRLWFNENQQGAADPFTSNITNSTNFLYLGIGPGATAATVANPLDGDIAEAIVFNSNISVSQRNIIENYLSAKYNISILAAANAYTDDDGAGVFDYEMAGLWATATDQVTDAQGSGMIRINNPSNLGSGESFLWAHNGQTLISTTTDVPAGVQAKFNRIWAVSETGNVGTLDVTVDLSSQSPVTASDLRLVIDHDNDGIFNEAGTIIIAGAQTLSCNRFLFAAVPDASLTASSRFTIGTSNKIQTPLPIELLSFYGLPGDGGVELHWTTATEHNSDYFAIERSLDGEKFNELLRETAAGTSMVQRAYSTVDYSAPVGKNYYRLRMVDYSGEFTYSKIIAVENPFVKTQVIVSPNPVSIGSDLDVRITGADAGEMYFELYDMMGRRISTTAEKQSTNYFKIKTSSVQSTGFYVLKVRGSEWTRESVQRIYLSE
jgi:hypothetical protein